MTKRIYSLDVLRGVAIAIMLFLDGPPDKIYSILEHPSWAGLTIPDIALPMFAFAMGAAAAISMSKREPSVKKNPQADGVYVRDRHPLGNGAVYIATNFFQRLHDR